MSEFLGRVVIITGASGGLGRTVTDAFLSSGATVVGVATSWKNRAPSADKFIPVDADLSSPDEAQTVVTSTIQRASRLDALIHLAGGYAAGKPVVQTPDDLWDHMMNLNLRTAVNAIRAALPPLLDARRGRIIAVGSRAGSEPAASSAAYCTSKAALHMLIRCVAEEVKSANITANAVLPSVIDTPATRSAMPSADTSRWVTPASLARLIQWIASDAAADLNGALIPIYGRV